MDASLAGMAAKDIQSDLATAGRALQPEALGRSDRALPIDPVEAPALSIINLQIGLAYRRKGDTARR